jgi:hypothetical protein
LRELFSLLAGLMAQHLQSPPPLTPAPSTIDLQQQQPDNDRTGILFLSVLLEIVFKTSIMAEKFTTHRFDSPMILILQLQLHLHVYQNPTSLKDNHPS